VVVEDLVVAGLVELDPALGDPRLDVVELLDDVIGSRYASSISARSSRTGGSGRSRNWLTGTRCQTPTAVV
jgi:hypothetical protein